jgi:flagellar hook-associated protein 2
MASSTSSVDGLISGMDTSTIISQLMQLEKAPQDRLVQQQQALASKITSYQSVNSKFLTLQSAADKLTLPETWTARTATSSSSSVSATAATGALTGSITFDVEQIAKAQAYVSHDTLSSTSAIVTTSPSVTITKGDANPVTVNTGDGSLAAVVAGINAANAGVRAAAVQVAPGSFRLQLTSTTTGADSDFTIADGADTSPFGTLDETVAGQDASLLVGDVSSAGKYHVTSHTNTFTDVLPGVTLTVKAPATAVTVDVAPAGGGLAGNVQDMVTAANNVLAEIKKQTAYDTANKVGAPLVGDSIVRSLQSEVLGLVTSSGTTSMSTIGIQVAKDGTITFDADKFQSAFAADPAGTAALLMPGGKSTHPDPAGAALASTVTLLKAADQTQLGTYDVKVTQAARQARVEVTGTLTDGEKLTVNVPGKTALVLTAGPTDDLTSMARRINEASATGNLGIVARVESGALEIRTQNYGASPTLSASTDGTLVVGSTIAGADVAGTINGVVAKGSGQTLIAPADDPQLRGAALKITATDADVAAANALAGPNQGLLARWTYAPGLAQRMDSLAGDAVRTGTGRLTTVIAGEQSQIDDLDTKISDWDVRLQTKEDAYRLQYANLETALGKLKDQGSWLSGQLASLPTSS